MPEGEAPEGSAELVANAIEAAALCAADQGLPLTMAESVTFTFAPDGGVKVDVVAGGETQSVDVSAADVAARSDYDEDSEGRESAPPPAPAG